MTETIGKTTYTRERRTALVAQPRWTPQQERQRQELQDAVDRVAADPHRALTREGMWIQVGKLLGVSGGCAKERGRRYGIACPPRRDPPPIPCPKCGTLRKGVRVEYATPFALHCARCARLGST